uniref:TSA: Wollemia nobilis Ref_Wollemi_Transcript_15320_1887 transcribed RNA sequence n=1 Tax=Wollemia nobilis TaxID=56998 RepID=A0A0C9RSA9_9CONI
MDRYHRVEKPRPEVPIGDNEIRITTQGMPRNYITYATTLLRERGASEVVLKAMGKAISKTVTIAEIIKRRIPNLHQNTTISSAPITYMWEPLEEGLLPLETTRHVSMITITLSTRQLDATSAGYQPPLPADQVKPLPEMEYEGDDSLQDGRGKGRAIVKGTGRGGNVAAGNFQNGDARGFYDAPDNGWNQGRGRFRGRGRGRSFGRGRGFYGGPAQDNSNYNDFGMGGNDNGPRGQGRGRGRASGSSQYGNGNFNDNSIGTGEFAPRGRGGRGRGRFGDDRNYSDNGYRRGQGRGRGRFGGAPDGGFYNEYGMGGGELPFRGRGRGRGRARGRGGRT